MKRGILKKTIKGLPYRIGQTVPVYRGRDSWLWHVWKTIIRIPDSHIEIKGDYFSGRD
jgi:hypothetical protein